MHISALLTHTAPLCTQTPSPRQYRRRQLYIRTYAVVVLNEECGMLEWVHNTEALRHVLVHRYKARDWHTNIKEIRRHYAKLTKQELLNPDV